MPDRFRGDPADLQGPERKSLGYIGLRLEEILTVRGPVGPKQ